MNTNNIFNTRKEFILSILIFVVLCSFLVSLARADEQNNSVSSNDVSSGTTLSNAPMSDSLYVNLDELNQTSVGTSDELNQSDIQANETSLNMSNIFNATESNLSFSASTEPDTEGGDSAYQYINLETIENQSNSEQNDSGASSEMIDYVLYNGNKKEIETQTMDGSDLVINVDEIVISGDDWKKEVRVSSNKHHSLPVTVYSDVPVEAADKVLVFWKEEQTFLAYENFGANADNLTERISWTVPHLSEQNFELSLSQDNGTIETTGTTGTITITPVNYSSSILFSTVELNFIVNNTVGNDTYCNLSLFKSGAIVTASLSNSSNPSYNFSVDNGLYTWNITCKDYINNLANSSEDFFTVSLLNNPQINFTSSASQINKDVSLAFFVNISVQNSPIQYVLDWGDGSSLVNPGSMNVTSLNVMLNHTYHSTGTYTAVLSVFNSGSSYTRNVTVLVNNANSNTDSSGPQISLLAPPDNEVIVDDQINFSYRAVDNVYVANCTLSIYFYANNSLLGTSVYSNLNKNVNSKTINISLTNFDEGAYSWDVGCYDNSSNYDEESRDFDVSHSGNSVLAVNSEDTLNISASDKVILDNINDLISKANAFIAKEDNYGMKEKEAMADLKLDDTVVNYKKVLMQMKQDISYNLAFMQDESLRQNRRQQIKDQITEMQTDIPSDISVEDSYDYYKTESKPVIKEIIKNYSALEKENVDNLDFNAISDYLASLQENAIISTNAKNVKITYSDRAEEITLVRKSVEIKNNSFDSFIEYVPPAVSSSSIVFVTNSKSLGSQYFEVQLKDLQESKIIYYIKDNIALKGIERTSTVLLSSNSPFTKLSGISGLATFFQSGGQSKLGFYAVLFIFISLVALGGTYYMKQYTVSRMAKGNEDFREIVLKINNADKAIKDQDFESAKNDYRAIKERYLKLPENARKLLYKKIYILQIRLDRKEAITLVKEFMHIAKEGRKEDALLIYNKIKSIYPRLLEKDRQRIYEKINPHLSSLLSKS